MLGIIDKYIIRQYLATFAFVVVLFSMLACVVDFSEHLDNFQRYDAPIKGIIFEYYLLFIPYIITLIWPIFCLVAVIYFTSRLANNAEIISMLNTGMSFGRLMRPYWVAATIITLLGLTLNHVITPMGNKIKTDFENVYVHGMSKDRGKTNDVHLFTSDTSKIYINRYIKRDSTARGVMIEHFKNGELVSILSAENMKALPEERKWKIKNYYERRFLGMDVPITEGKEQVMHINLLPDDFVAHENAKDAMTTSELSRHIERQKSRGAGGTALYEVEKHRRYAQPFTVYILTIIGMSLSARKVRGGMGWNLALGVALGSIYVFLFQFSTTLSINGNVPAVLAVWSPSVLFGAVAAFLVFRAQK